MGWIDHVEGGMATEAKQQGTSEFLVPILLQRESPPLAGEIRRYHQGFEKGRVREASFDLAGPSRTPQPAPVVDFGSWNPVGLRRDLRSPRGRSDPLLSVVGETARGTRSGIHRRRARMTDSLQRCPYCDELIRKGARKCRYCLEFLPGQEADLSSPGPAEARDRPLSKAPEPTPPVVTEAPEAEATQRPVPLSGRTALQRPGRARSLDLVEAARAVRDVHRRHENALLLLGALYLGKAILLGGAAVTVLGIGSFGGSEMNGPFALLAAVVLGLLA